MNPRMGVLGSVSFGWLHREAGFTFDEPFFMDPRRRLEQETAINAFVADRWPDEPIYNFEAGLVQVAGRQRPVALVGAVQPNLILGAALGSPFAFQPDKDPDIATTPLADGCDLDRLRGIDWRETWPTRAFLDQVDAMRRELADTHAIIPPLFWDTTGRVTLHGPITSAQKLLGQRVYMALIDEPSLVRGLFDWITESYIALARLFAEATELNITGVHVGECSACMVGPDHFETFALPVLNRLAAALGPVRLHSCGGSDHLIDNLAKIDRLACANVGSPTSVARIRERMGSIRIDLIPHAELLTFGRPAAVDAWVREIMRENAGGPLQIQYHLDLGQPERNVLQIHRTMRELGFPCEREQVF